MPAARGRARAQRIARPLVVAVPGDRDNCACFGANLKALCLLPLLVPRPRRGNRGLGLLSESRVRHLGVGSGFAPGQHGEDPGAAAERRRLVIGLLLRDPEHGGATPETRLVFGF